MAYYAGSQELTSDMAGMSLHSEESAPSAPPPSAPPPPYNPLEYQRPALQQQVSLPNLSYEGPTTNRGSQLYQSPPPYSAPPYQPSNQQAGNWGQRSSYPSTDQQRYMSLPRQSTAPAEWGVMPGQGHVQATVPASYVQGYPQPQGASVYQQQSSYVVPTAQPAPQVQVVAPMKPTGHNIMNLFVSGNILYLIPAGSPHRCPIRTDWGNIRGGGLFKEDDSKFEVVVPRQDPVDWVVTLRNFEHKSRYICINRKGEIKARSGTKNTCEFHIRPVGSLESSVVCFESAVTPGVYLGMRADGSPANTSNLEPTSKQAQFYIRAHRIVNVYTSNLPLKVFGRISVLNQLKDRCTLQLRNKATRKFLGIDLRGNVMENHDSSDPHVLFMVFDRGMGVVSLRSYKHPGFWLRVVNGALQGKGVADLDGDFWLKENYDGTVRLESVYSPGVVVVPPAPLPRKKSKSVPVASPPPSSPDFNMSVVTVVQ